MSDTPRDQVETWLESQELEAPIFDDFDDAIIGLSFQAPGRPPAVVYSFDKLIAVLIDQGLSLEEATEYVDANMAGAWIGDATPIIVREVEP